MAFADNAANQPSIQLLQRSLKRGRLGHAYLLSGNQMEDLEDVARNLVKTLNCLDPVREEGGALPVDCCDRCANCTKVSHGNHGDVHWLRPESKTRLILTGSIKGVREKRIQGLIEKINLKTVEGGYKSAVIVSADRIQKNGANAFLKTLEEPPPRTVIILLTTEPQRVMDTIVSRCLRLTFGSGGHIRLNEQQMSWIESFSEVAAQGGDGLLDRYKLLGGLLGALAEMKDEITVRSEAASPLSQYADVDAKLREQWENELEASIEAEYRGRRGELLVGLQWWLRDVWLQALQADEGLLTLKQFGNASRQVAGRIGVNAALENLRVVEQTYRLLHTNVQEALAMEVGFLKLKLG
jgi:DNA polymerase III subunit delta'